MPDGHFILYIILYWTRPIVKVFFCTSLHWNFNETTVFLDQKQHQPGAGFHPEPVNHHDESAMCSFRTAGTPAKPSSAVAAPNTPIQDDLALSDTATADSCWGSATFNPVSVFSVLIQKEYHLDSTT